MLKISLTEEVRREMLGSYTDAMYTLTKGVHTFFENLEEIYTTHQYSPLRKTAEVLAKIWSEDINSQVTKEVNNWLVSEASIEHILRNMGAFGDDSSETQQVASSLQMDLLEETKNLFNNGFNLSPISEAVSMEKNLKQIFEDFHEASNNFKNTVSDVSEDLKGLVSRKADENQLFVSFGYLVNIVFSALELQVDNINKQLDLAYESISERGKKAENIGDTTATTLTSELESNAFETDFSDISHLFEP